MENEEILNELGEEVSGLEEELESTEDKEDKESVKEKQQQAEELVGEIKEQLEFLSQVAEKNHNR